MESKRVLTVTQLNLYVKSLLDSSVYLKNVYITGEISNFTNHYRTGHFYLTLKDDTGAVKAVMFRSAAAKLAFTPENGMKVICRGRVSLYERDGQYQMYIEEMQPDGVGALSIAYEQLKQKLESEGLFETGRKGPIPKFPSKIAVITSDTGAAVRDILNILSRRMPSAEVILCPVQVQGDLAAPQMTAALETLNRHRLCDVIIIGRGGGSIEDLWAFNNEALARTIADSKIPVISAVGHETDFTICDFVSDLRAPTPSAAAELAVADRRELAIQIDLLKKRMRSGLIHTAEIKRKSLESLLLTNCLKNPMFAVDVRRQRLDLANERFFRAAEALFNNWNYVYLEKAKRLNALNPLGILKRGYAAVYSDEKMVLSPKELKPGQTVTVKIGDGGFEAVIQTLF